MSQQLINRSPDLRRLREDGYDISISNGYLVLHDVPYLNAKREVLRGKPVVRLDLNGDVTRQPEDHVAYFSGQMPCKHDGTPLPHIINTTKQRFSDDVVVDFTFSSKPPAGRYTDYYEKITTYVAILENFAHAVDATVSAKTFVVRAADENSVFEYDDTASTRANISAITDKLRTHAIAIIGLGGTGAYILDQVAKTPVREIHLYDGDRFGQHNAFRTPGAPTIATLRAAPMKVDHFKNLYAPMHKQISAHPVYVDATNVNGLAGSTFVFIAIDRNAARKLIVDFLERARIPFIDVGMGVPRSDDALGGILRVTASTPARLGHLQKYVPLADHDVDNEYERNIQVADLNALNAALAVIRWKKYSGFYADSRGEHHMTYTVRANMLISEEEVV